MSKMNKRYLPGLLARDAGPAIILVGMVLVILLTSVHAGAYQITFNFSGYIYAVDPSVSGTFNVGQSVTGFFTFNSEAAGQSFSPGKVLDPSITYYPRALTAFQATIAGYSVGLGGENRIFVINNDAAGRDRYLAELLAPSGANVAGLPVSDFFLSFQDFYGTTINDGSLPLSPAILGNFPSAAGALDFVTGINPKNRVTFSINSVTSPVPLPSTMLFLGSGLIGLIGLRRKFRK
jgi:PEP-CTERM motif